MYATTVKYITCEPYSTCNIVVLWWDEEILIACVLILLWRARAAYYVCIRIGGKRSWGS